MGVAVLKNSWNRQRKFNLCGTYHVQDFVSYETLLDCILCPVWDINRIGVNENNLYKYQMPVIFLGEQAG